MGGWSATAHSKSPSAQPSQGNGLKDKALFGEFRESFTKELTMELGLPGCLGYCGPSAILVSVSRWTFGTTEADLSFQKQGSFQHRDGDGDNDARRSLLVVARGYR